MSAIACDIDGVLANFVKGFTTLVNSLDPAYPIITSQQDVETRDSHKWWGEDNYTNVYPVVEKAWNLIKTCNSNWEFWLSLEPLGSLEPLRLRYREIPIVFLTRRDGEDAWRQTNLWLEKQGITEPLLYRVRSGEEKEKLCAKMGISVILDDSPHIVEACLLQDMDVIMPAYRYNSHIPPHPRLFRAFGADAAITLAEVLSQHKVKSIWPNMFQEMRGKHP